MVKAEDAASYITVENSFISAHFDFKFQETSNKYDLGASNIKKFIVEKMSPPSLHFKLSSDKMKASDVQVVLFDSDSTKTQSIKNWLAHYQKVKQTSLAIVLVKNVKQINIKGHLSLDRDFNLFINGEFVDYLKSYKQMRQILDHHIISTKRLLKGVIIKPSVHTCMVSTEIHSMQILVKGQTPPKYLETIELAEEHANSKFSFTNALEEKTEILIKAKFHLLTRESIVFMSLLNTNEFNFNMELYLFNVHSLGLRLARTAY
jgi:hypothetical protein